MSPGLYINDTDHDRLLLNSADHEYLIRNEVVHWTRDNPPAISAFSVSPLYLIDSAQSPIAISATTTAPNVTIHEDVARGTRTNLTLSKSGSVYTANRPQAPVSDASYQLDISDALKRSNHRAIRFYRWLTPTVGISEIDRYVSHTGVVFREHIKIRITRTGTPLPRLSIVSSAGTASVATLDPNTPIGDRLSADIWIGRTRPTGSDVSDRLTLTGTSSLPIETTPKSLSATATLDITWRHG